MIGILGRGINERSCHRPALRVIAEGLLCRHEEELALPLGSMQEAALRSIGCSQAKKDVEDFGDHFGGNPTNAGRTFTGGLNYHSSD
jgi:hypothetical protein